MSFRPNPHNLPELASTVVDSMKPDLLLCKQVLSYSQSIIGDYKHSARTSDHFGWLVCDGRLLDRNIYKACREWKDAQVELSKRLGQVGASRGADGPSKRRRFLACAGPRPPALVFVGHACCPL